MNRESCCTCARLLAHIDTGSQSGIEPPSYSASAAEDGFHLKLRRKSFNEKEEGEEGLLSEKTASYTNDWEKDEERARGQLEYDRALDKQRFEIDDTAREKEDKVQREEEEGGKRGSRRGERRLPCCARIICRGCIESNERLGTYCLFCQVRSGDMMDGDTARFGSNSGGEPPSYGSLPPASSLPTSNPPSNPPLPPLPLISHPPVPSPDIIHHLSHPADTLSSLSLRYSTPLPILRKKNNITSDHLLLARKTILIPGEWYRGESLSPWPGGVEEEERRKGCVRKFMLWCKVFEYDIAVLYLEQANYDLELAMGVYKDDERWEKDNPISNKAKGKGKAKLDAGRRRFTGQI